MNIVYKKISSIISLVYVYLTTPSLFFAKKTGLKRGENGVREPVGGGEIPNFMDVYTVCEESKMRGTCLNPKDKERIDQINVFLDKNYDKSARIITWSEPIRITHKPS